MPAWGRVLDVERVWAIEDCRHVSSGPERFLVDSGERVVRVPPKLMGQSRVGEGVAGKSDPIDALPIARAALREGPETLPVAHLDESAMQIKLLPATARTSSPPARRIRTVSVGTCTPSGRSSRFPPGGSTGSSGSTASTGSSPAPGKAPG
jgi:transposase